MQTKLNLEEAQALHSSEGFGLFRRYMEKMKEEIKEEWARGSYTVESESGTIQLNARQIGKVEVLEKLLDPELTYEEILEYINE